MDNKRLSVVERAAFQPSYFEMLAGVLRSQPSPTRYPRFVSRATRSLSKQLPPVTCTSLFCAVGYHSSRARNGVPRRKPHRDGASADGGHPREGFRIQLV